MVNISFIYYIFISFISFISFSNSANLQLLEYYQVTKKTKIFLEHNAFTDLSKYNNKWYLTYRNSDSHVNGRNGEIVIMSSGNFRKWKVEKKICIENYDLRDLKLMVTSENKLYVYFHGVYTDSVGSKTKKDWYSEYINNKWSEIKNIKLDSTEHNDYWPWRIIEQNNVFYVIAYKVISVNRAYQGKQRLLKELKLIILK